MRDFRRYTIWQDGMQIVKDIYLFSQDLPNDEKFGLVSQIKRASVSIPSNIAEGCSRSSDIEFKRFLEIALGSAFELETQLLIVKDLNNKKINENDNLIKRLYALQKGINSLIQKIKNS